MPEVKFTIEATLYDKVRDLKGIYKYESDVDNPENHEYLWMEGNYSCDDNRGNLLADVLKLPRPDYPCGQDRVILKSLTIDGRFICKDVNN